MAKAKTKKEGKDALITSDLGGLLENIRTFDALHLDGSFNSVEEYTQVFCRLDREISATSRQILPEPLLIGKYINGLGSCYRDFGTRFIVSNPPVFDQHDAPLVALADAVWEALEAQNNIVGLQNVLPSPSEELLERESLVSSIMGKRFEPAKTDCCEYCKHDGHVESQCWRRYPHLKPPSPEIPAWRTEKQEREEEARRAMEKT